MDYTNRDVALALLLEFTQSVSLQKHALAVEATLRAMARKYDANVDEWGAVGLLHDFDYERYPTPEEHTIVGSQILRERGYPEHFIRAIASHADYNHLTRESDLEKSLYAADELSGFVTAVALVRPTRSVFDVDVASVKKKLKDKAFAKGVHREDVVRGAEELGVPLDEHIEFVIMALRDAADVLGLRGQSGGE